MMEYHILNGDCLKEKLKNKFSNLLVMREALVQGPTKANDLDYFFEKRALFISKEYEICSKEQYLNDTKNEFTKMQNIQKNSNINFWFGNDLFCQINFWFLMDFLKEKQNTNNFYLVIPQGQANCSFGNEQNIEESFNKRIKISNEDISIFAKLWKEFQEENHSSMNDITVTIREKYEFIGQTIDALIDKSNIDETLHKLSKEEKDFQELYKKFSLLHPIYGYGDIQVAYILKN